MTPTAIAWKREALGPLLIFNCIGGAWQRRPPRPVVSASAPAGFLSTPAARALSTHGVSRVVEFLSYPDGWDFGRGKALSTVSLQRMERFFDRYSAFERTPSIFLTSRGNLLLGWEDSSGDGVELEFAPDAYLLYLAGSDVEHSFPAERLDELLDTLRDALPGLHTNGAS